MPLSIGVSLCTIHYLVALAISVSLYNIKNESNVIPHICTIFGAGIIDILAGIFCLFRSYSTFFDEEGIKPRDKAPSGRSAILRAAFLLHALEMVVAFYLFLAFGKSSLGQRGPLALSMLSAIVHTIFMTAVASVLDSMRRLTMASFVVSSLASGILIGLCSGCMFWWHDDPGHTVAGMTVLAACFVCSILLFFTTWIVRRSKPASRLFSVPTWTNQLAMAYIISLQIAFLPYLAFVPDIALPWWRAFYFLLIHLVAGLVLKIVWEVFTDGLMFGSIRLPEDDEE